MQHLHDAVTNAALVTEPGPHMVIPDLLPADLYALLLETIPPLDGFDIASKLKLNFDPEATTIAPERSRHTWQRFQRDVVDAVLTPMLLDRFRPYLTAAYRSLFGPDLAEDALGLEQHAFRGRLMLRLPGFTLKPHRDTKIAVLTGLTYFARPGDLADYGTALYRVENDQPAPSMKTFYPESCGARVELARSVPFVGNAGLVFLNTPGMAHGTAIPRDAPPGGRYAYQFYIGPDESDLARLVLRMPADRQTAWAGMSIAPGDEY